MAHAMFVLQIVRLQIALLFVHLDVTAQRLAPALVGVVGLESVRNALLASGEKIVRTNAPVIRIMESVVKGTLCYIEMELTVNRLTGTGKCTCDNGYFGTNCDRSCMSGACLKCVDDGGSSYCYQILTL